MHVNKIIFVKFEIDEREIQKDGLLHQQKNRKILDVNGGNGGESDKFEVRRNTVLGVGDVQGQKQVIQQKSSYYSSFRMRPFIKVRFQLMIGM